MSTARNCSIGLVFAVVFLVAANVRADFVPSDYGISVIDDKNGDQGFYKLFNQTFGTLYTSTNDILRALGVDTNTTWTVNANSKLVGGDKNQSGFSGVLSIVDGAGNASVVKTAPTVAANNTLNLGINYAIDNNSFPVGSGVTFQLTVDRKVDYESQHWTLGSGTNADDNVYMLALDITDLYNAKYNGDFDTVYMFLWEDWKSGEAVRWGNKNAQKSYTDWDYADFIYIMTNVKPYTGTSTPEPATFAIFGLGLAALGLTRIRQRK